MAGDILTDHLPDHLAADLELRRAAGAERPDLYRIAVANNWTVGEVERYAAFLRDAERRRKEKRREEAVTRRKPW